MSEVMSADGVSAVLMMTCMQHDCDGALVLDIQLWGRESYRGFKGGLGAWAGGFDLPPNIH